MEKKITIEIFLEFLFSLSILHSCYLKSYDCKYLAKDTNGYDTLGPCDISVNYPKQITISNKDYVNLGDSYCYMPQHVILQQI